MMNTMNKIKKAWVVLLFTFLAGCSNGQDFFGVNLDEKGNQIKKLHDLLVTGKVEDKGRVLHEWAPQGVSDYDMFNGSSVGFVYNQGNNDLISRQRVELNTEFAKKFTEKDHLETQEWIPWDDNVEMFAYLDRFTYGNYTISIVYNIYSSTKNLDNPDFAELIIMLGGNNGE